MVSPPSNIHLIPALSQYYLIGKEDTYKCDNIEDFEMRSLSWIIGVGPQCHHVYPGERKAEAG